MATRTNAPINQDQKKNAQEAEDGKKRGFEQGEGQGSSGSNFEPREELPANKGYEEDHPGHPVRTTGSLSEDQESGSIQPGDDREGKN
jgi:hypothetical protein